MKHLLILLFPALLGLSACEKDCFQSDGCRLSPEVGNCEALIPKYYYSPSKQKCETFMWGGCGGVIPFEELQACQDSCHCQD